MTKSDTKPKDSQSAECLGESIWIALRGVVVRQAHMPQQG